VVKVLLKETLLGFDLFVTDEVAFYIMADGVVLERLKGFANAEQAMQVAKKRAEVLWESWRNRRA